MLGAGDPQPEFAELDDDSAAAFRQAVRLGRFDHEALGAELGLSSAEITRVEGVLSHLCLLRPMPGDPELLAPVSPDAAAAELLGSSEAQIRVLQQAVTEVRSRMLSLMPAYFEGRRQRNQVEAFDVVTDRATIQPMVNELSARCQYEVATVLPGGGRPAEMLAEARKSAQSIRARGARLRTIYQHTARNDLVTRAYVRDVTAYGAEIRTADEVIDVMMIFDREVVFLPDHTLPDQKTGAVIVRQPILVSYLCSVFEHLWNNATPFNPDARDTDPITDEVKRSIIRLMGMGYKDEMVARRLGMSVRTCRRHISEITEELKATSRFQAGANAALSGLLDGAPAAD